MQAFMAEVVADGNFCKIVLSNTLEKTSVEVLQFGGLLNAFSVEVNNKPLNIIDGFTNNETAVHDITNGFKSALLSPFTCRMNKGRYQFNNQLYQTNKFFLPPHAIHGLVYDAVYTIDATEANTNFASVQLSYTYTGNENGYPFSYMLQHVYTLQSNRCLQISTTVSNTSNVNIPYAQGWHPYFTLGESINDCSLQIHSNKQVEFDDTLIPTGNILPYSLFTEAHQINHIALDNCFEVLATNNNKVCTLANKNLALHIYNNSNYPYVQVYTPPHRNSIAIENLSGAPDCFNNGLGLTLIEPNSSIIFATTYQTQVF